MKAYLLGFVFVSLFSAFTLQCEAQEFNKRYSLQNQIDNAFNIDQIDSSGYWLTVASEDSSRNFTIVTIKIDEQGDTLWTNTYGQAGKDLFVGWSNSLAVTSDSGLIMGGALRDTSETFGHLVKFNKAGDTVWTKTFGDSSNFHIFSQAIPTRDGGYAVTGHTNRSDKNELDAWLVKTDSAGNLEWEKTYGIWNEREASSSIFQTSDGGFLLSGERVHTGGNPAVRNIDPLVIKVDSAGNQLWKHINDTPGRDGGADAIETSDSNYVYGASISVSQNDSSKAALVKLNRKNGNVLWSKTYGFYSGGSSFLSIQELSDQSLIAAGVIGIGFIASHGMILKTKSNGDSLFMRIIQESDTGKDNRSALWDIIPTGDGGYISCGRTVTFPPDTLAKFSWVIKLDSNGCGIGNCTLVSLREHGVAQNSLLLYPNPSNGVVHLECAETLSFVQIFNVQGQLLRQQSLQDNSLELPPNKGMYLL